MQNLPSQYLCSIASCQTLWYEIVYTFDKTNVVLMCSSNHIVVDDKNVLLIYLRKTVSLNN